ncbi:capsular polysaccharide export protein, LipB/KpsS family [Vampirovibrio chlorellavorus]|uniref:capsular polysaccharide export protein, LipB/KpsS family n=1 Tax=Vampirovibrio chlorellavorus TaxID=758823 RepID=UPI0026E9364B|nr:hypothetical protein [Vampirovibrio chlorellavorus]
MPNLVEEAVKPAGLQEVSKAQQVCHVGTTIEKLPYLVKVIGAMPHQTIHVYTPSLSVSKALQKLQIAGKVIIPHLVEGVYSERWLFELSRKIAERRVAEVLALAPDVLRLRQFPAVSFEKLAIRRVSLSRLYYELSVFFALQQQVPVDEGTPLIFLSNFFDKGDVEAFAPPVTLSPFISVTPHFVGELPALTRAQKLTESFRKVASKFTVILGKEQGKALQRQLLQKLEQAESFYNALQQSPPFPTLRKLEQKIRHESRKPVKKFKKFRVRLNKLKLITLMRFNKWLITIFSGKQREHILILSPSINSRNQGYYKRLFKPLAHELLKRENDLILMLWNDDRKACKIFSQALSPKQGSVFSKSKSYFLSVTSLIELYKEREALFLADATTTTLFDDANGQTTALVKNTLGSINSMKYTTALIHFYAKNLDFHTVVGVEEDIEYISILNLLKPVLGRQYTTFIIPSCLPEYSVCYDCVSVDHLSVALPFVKRIFAEQNTNAAHLHVVGSQEWEEPEVQATRFPHKAEKLAASSQFVLGVLHQPIFVTMHGQTIYNNLTVNFLDIYERFLAQNPTACILIKPHPRDNLEQLKAYLPKNDRILVLPKETPNKLLYQRIDAAISIHSTMVSHALAHGVPVVSMYKYPDYVPLYDFIAETGGLATDSHEEALAWLARMANDPEFKTSVRQSMTALREDCLGAPSSQRIADILEAEIQTTRKASVSL